jgi:hypothetical protein
VPIYVPFGLCSRNVEAFVTGWLTSSLAASSTVCHIGIREAQTEIDDGGRVGDLAMKDFLLFLSFAGAATYGFLIVLHNVLPPANSEYALVDRTEPHHPAVRRLRSWGPELSSLWITTQSRLLPSQETVAKAQDAARQPSTDARLAAASDEKVLAPESEAVGRWPAPATNLASDSSTQTAMDTMSEPLSRKAASPKSKKRSRSARPATRAPDDPVLATSAPPNGRWISRGQRRGLGLFLFGRFAAR